MAWLVGPMGVGGLALALSVTASLEVLGLLWALRSRLRGLDGAALLSSLVRSTAAAAVAALAMFGGLQLTDAWFPSLLDHALGRLAVLLVLSAVGGVAYLAVAALLRSPEIGELRRLFGRRFSPAEIIREEP
jgi:putative peptidoglycan lipid II flippase